MVSEIITKLYKKNSPFLLLETERQDAENQYSYLFHNSIDTIEITKNSEYPAAIQKIEQALDKGNWLAGYFSYEFKNDSNRGDTIHPLFSLGVYPKPFLYSPEENFKFSSESDFRLSHFQIGIGEDEYCAKIENIRSLIAQGKFYQLNFTFPIHFDFNGNPLALYAKLKESQKTSYSAFYKKNNYYLLSLSPELFFRIENKKIISRPMKGTAKPQNGEVDTKLKAENFMILDLLRNDLGKICRFGSVQVKDLLRSENFSTLNQYTSGVEGILLTEKVDTIFSALFPAGSITGAPKSSVMRYISEFENYPRGIYTGAMGFISPERKFVFNVMIRTLELKTGKGRMCVGSGIVWDSVSKNEYSECILKSTFLLQNSGIELLETILFKNQRFYFLQEHLNRLEKSCFQFGYEWNLEQIREELENSAKDKQGIYKVRILLGRSKQQIEWKPLPRVSRQGKIQISRKEIYTNNWLLLYKTTSRELYDTEYKIALKKGLTDFVFLNEKKQVTETCIANLFVKIGNCYYTPPLSSGVLPGVFRAKLLQKFPKYFKEGILQRQDLQDSESIFLCNSVRGIIKVKLDETD